MVVNNITLSNVHIRAGSYRYGNVHTTHLLWLNGTGHVNLKSRDFVHCPSRGVCHVSTGQALHTLRCVIRLNYIRMIKREHYFRHSTHNSGSSVAFSPVPSVGGLVANSIHLSGSPRPRPPTGRNSWNESDGPVGDQNNPAFIKTNGDVCTF